MNVLAASSSTSCFGGLFLLLRSLFYCDIPFKLTLFPPHENLNLINIGSRKTVQENNQELYVEAMGGTNLGENISSRI